jgi:hypothetical protein
LREVEQLERRLGGGLEALPELELGAKAFGLPEYLLCRALIVPEARFAYARVKFAKTLLLSGEVKDAPRSPGSSWPGRGSRQAPLRAASRVLEKDRPKLDEAQRALASGDDGVHAGAVGVVGADAAIPIAIEGCCVATVAAISLTRDEIDEGRFLCLLHYSPQCGDAIIPSVGRTI